MSLLAKNRKRISAGERRSAAASLLRGVGRVLLRICTVIAIGGLLVGATRQGYRWATTSKTFALEVISVQGLQHISETDLIRLGGLSPGQNMFRLDMSGVEKAFASHPWVSSVRVKRRFPSTLTITVQEHVPAALAALGDLYVINEEGQPFKKLQTHDDLDLPVLTGFTREQYLAAPEECAAQFRRAIAAGRAYARSEPSAQPLSEVRLDPNGLTLVVGEGQEIVLNDTPSEQVFERLSRVKTELERRGLSAEVIHLENRVRPGWISVKLAPALSERKGER